MAKDAVEARVDALVAQIAESSKVKGGRAAATALPTWIPSWVLEFAIATLLSQLKAAIKSEAAKATLRKVLKRVFDGIKAWYPDDPDFA